VVISRENLHDEARLREGLQQRLGGRARLIDGLGAVSVVGAGINATYANVRAGAETLASLGIEPAGTATSSFRITWMIPRDRTDEAVRALHAKFIESARPLLP
jgi:aspartate kinase